MLRAALAALLVATAAPAIAQDLEEVDLELVLMADASGSIDEAEIMLQRQGYAKAMVDPEVLFAIAHGGATGRVAVTYVEWAAANSQDVVVDWMVVEDEASARLFGARLLEAPRRARGSNAIGAALLRGLDLIETNSYDGFRKVIDFSGDSSWNGHGPSIETAREIVLRAGVTINGLAILCTQCSGRPRSENLEKEYEERIIGGFGAFVVTADGPENFARAVRRKLIMEISDAGAPPRPVVSR